MSSRNIPEARVFLKAMNFSLCSSEMMAYKRYIDRDLTVTEMHPQYPATVEESAYTYDFESIKFRVQEKDGLIRLAVEKDEIRQEKRIFVGGLLLAEGENMEGRLFVTPQSSTAKMIIPSGRFPMVFPSKPLKKWEDLRVGMVVGIGDRCGISEHTSYFLGKMKRRPKIYAPSDIGRIVESVARDDIDIMHIQHEYSFFDSNDLIAAVEGVKRLGVKVIMDMHTVTDTPFAAVMGELADKIIVHNPLAQDGSPSNQKTEVVPLATPVYEDFDKRQMRERFGITGDPVIASFGFINRNKCFDETLEAVAQLKEKYPQICFLLVGSLHPKGKEADYLSHLHNHASELGVNVFWKTDFYPIEIVHQLLSCADLTCLYYRNIHVLSGSGPARFCLASHRPLIVSDIPMFAEFGDAVVRVEAGSTANLGDAMLQLLENGDSQKALIEKGNGFLSEISAETVARRFEEIYRELGCEKT